MDFRMVASSGASPYLVSGNFPGAAAKTEANRARVVSSGGAVVPNLVSGNYLGAGAKNPYPQPASFEIAPLVGKSKAAKTCEAGCTMPCCAKK